MKKTVTAEESIQETPSEIREYTAVNQQRRYVLPRAALVGLAAGLVATLFRLLLSGGDRLRNAIISWSHQFPEWGWLFPVLFSAGGAFISVLVVRRYSPDASGSGIPALKAVLQRFRSMRPLRLLPVKFAAGLFALSSGMVLGREGPTVQMGGAVGDAISTWLKVPERERRTLTAAGAGAGLAAAFNAPLSGLTFVLEEVQRDFHPIVFAAAFVAAIIADIVARLFTSSDPVFSVPSYAALPLGSLPFFALLGILAGLLGVLFNRALVGSLNLFSRFHGRWSFAAAAGVGALIGLIGWFSPTAVGGGHTLAENVLAGNLLLSGVPVWFTLRFLLTVGSYGTGAAGGIFAPLLVLGALLGLGVGQVSGLLSPGLVPEPAVFAVVGMAAYFTAIVRAPLTGILLIVEMTGSYAQMMPLLISCFSAYAVAEFLKDSPIYEQLLERDLKRLRGEHYLRKPMIVDFLVQKGAPFDGKEVRMLGLPPGCVLVRCMQNGQELVPTAETRLEAYMKITAVIAPQAAHGLEILSRGCRLGGFEEVGTGE